MLLTRVWLVLSDSITLQRGSLIDASSLLQSVDTPAIDRDAPAIDRVWALPPWGTLGCILKVFEFGRFRRDTIMDNGYIDYTYIYIYSSSFMVNFSSLHVSLWPLSDLLEHYPLVVWGVFACVVVVDIERTCLEVELSSFHWSVKFTIAESLPITVAGLSFHFVIIP